MTFLIMLVVKVLDPIGFAVVFALSFITREKWIIPAAAIGGALVTETILTATQYTRTWGRGIVIGLLASAIQALVCYWLVGKIKAARAKKAKTNEA